MLGPEITSSRTEKNFDGLIPRLFKSNLLWSFIFPISVGTTLPSVTIANPRPVPGPIIKSTLDFDFPFLIFFNFISSIA